MKENVIPGGIAAMMYGCARVSTKEQNEARQIAALTEAGVDQKNIYLDKQSGNNFNYC